MEVQQDSNQFLVQLQKPMPSQIAMTVWAKNMDLLAIATFDNYLQLFRINYKAQLVFQQQQSQPIKCVAFSLDSHFIAYGLYDGSIKILKTQNGEKVTIVQKLQKSQIQTLIFRKFKDFDPKTFMPFQKNSMQGKLILPVSPHKNCNKNAIIKINYFNNLTQDFIFLLSSERNKTLILLNGFIPVAQIDFSNIKLNNLKVHFAYYNEHFKAIVSQQGMDHFNLHMIDYQSKILEDYHEDIIKFHCIMGYVTQLLNFVQGTFPAMEMILRQISTNYNSKMGQIDDQSVEGIDPCQELFRFLNLGLTSSPLVNFFTKSLYDSKVPQKLDQSLTASFAKLHDIILQSTQNSLQRAVILLKKLKTMASSRSYQVFGVTQANVQQVLSFINRVYTMSQILLVQSTQTKFDIRNLLVWLNKSAIKTSQQNDVEIQNTKSYLNKYTVDFTRLHKFLSDSSKFNLNHLKFFFNKDNDIRKIPIQEPQFRLLFRNKDKVNPQLSQNYKYLQKLLDIQDVIVPEQVHNFRQTPGQYSSFQKEMIQCKKIWKNLVDKPMGSLSNLLSKKSQSSFIGKVEFNELFPMEIQHSIVENELLIYYVQRVQGQDRLVKYNCDKKEKGFVYTNRYHIVSIAVGQSILVVLQQKMSNQKMIGQIINEQYNGSEIQIGKRISKVNGQVDINSSQRGLNSLIQNKTKLIIFD